MRGGASQEAPPFFVALGDARAAQFGRTRRHSTAGTTRERRSRIASPISVVDAPVRQNANGRREIPPAV
jgi:hypothetical protein